MSWSKEVFAKNLRYYMEREGLTQKELSDVVGVSAPTFSDWINGKIYPRIDKIERLADYFGVLKSDLIEQKEPSTQISSESEKLLVEANFLLVQLPPSLQKVMLEHLRGVVEAHAEAEKNK